MQIEKMRAGCIVMYKKFKIVSDGRIIEKEITNLLKSDSVIDIENAIAKQMGCNIYKDDLPLLLNFINDEIIQSELSIEELKIFINNNGGKVIAFAVSFLANQSPKSLSTGIALTYSIYLIYLEYKSDELVEAYIKRRRIPNAKRFLLQLKKAKDALSE